MTSSIALLISSALAGWNAFDGVVFDCELRGLALAQLRWFVVNDAFDDEAAEPRVVRGLVGIVSEGPLGHGEGLFV